MEAVKKTFKVNVANAKELLLNVIPRIASEKWAEITKEREVFIIICFTGLMGPTAVIFVIFCGKLKSY